ncbi:uncharacterized protein LOC142320474 isoform X1 [Lycorma delicatula]|uniref:uncharacterized protein LOC142320474 isoform X1 n=1 Tax=Lycorma delicatula TaxID=130591 RepID=UPI003F5158FD
MTAIHWSNYDEVRNVLENCDNSELIVNCRSGPMMMLPLLQLASYLRNQQDAVKIVKLLLNHGAKLPVPRSWGYTPLHEAVKSGHINCIKLLLEYRANINAVDENGVSPLLLLVNEMIMSNTSSTLTIERYEMIVVVSFKRCFC